MEKKYLRMIRTMRQILRRMRVRLFLHRRPKRTFSVHRHVIMIPLRQYESRSYESFVEQLDSSDDVCSEPGLPHVPHFTTLQKAAARLGCNAAPCSGEICAHIRYC